MVKNEKEGILLESGTNEIEVMNSQFWVNFMALMWQKSRRSS